MLFQLTLWIRPCFDTYLERTESFKQDKFVLVFKISFMCSWQYNKQSFNRGSICKKAAETKIGITHWGSNCGQSSSRRESFFTHCISHSKIFISQWTEISISSKRWPEISLLRNICSFRICYCSKLPWVTSAKYPIFSTNSFWLHTNVFFVFFISSQTCMSTSELK